MRRAKGGMLRRRSSSRSSWDVSFSISRSSRDCSRSVVKLGSDLARNLRSVIVLYPQLRVILFHEFFDHLAALRGLLLVGVEGRNFLVRDFVRIVIEIARQQDAPGVGELEIQ